jgi:hypothetical protein
VQHVRRQHAVMVEVQVVKLWLSPLFLDAEEVVVELREE